LKTIILSYSLGGDTKRSNERKLWYHFVRQRATLDGQTTAQCNVISFARGRHRTAGQYHSRFVHLIINHLIIT